MKNPVVSSEIYIPVRQKKKISGYKIVIYVVLTLWAITTIAPLIWVLVNSFKSSDQILSSSVSLPKNLNLKNYKDVFGYADLAEGFINSMIISGSVVVLSGFFAGLASFVVARFEFRFKNAVKMFFFTSMLIPQFAVIVPNFMTLKDMGIMDLSGRGIYLALIIPQTASALSFAILILSGFMAAIPRELEEAAILDGCSIPGIFMKIALPLSIPAFATVSIINFLWSYNDLLLSLVYIPTKEFQPICVLLSLVSNIFGTNYGAMMSAITITIIPVIVLYCLSQEYVVKGMTAGAVKG